MTATQNIEVRAGSVSRLKLEKKVEAVTESASLTAGAEPAEIEEPSGKARSSIRLGTRM
jgi:hypothetical protein